MKVAIAMAIVMNACQSGPRTILVPADAIADPNTPTRPTLAPYVIRMTDGTRSWQVEIPSVDAAGAFVASIPLDPTQKMPETKSVQTPITPAASDEPDALYLESLARIGELYRRKQYELALVDLLRLEARHPDDERVLEMKGTLYLKLKRTALARTAWERVLAKNPDNTSVAAALSTLTED
ncbi:MAG: tetratricopeptide repeat protein [Deltaproteobacteria bacterium]|nr:tetratricopeptide repeat protein [Deltaproteobacteria bacterium]